MYFFLGGGVFSGNNCNAVLGMFPFNLYPPKKMVYMYCGIFFLPFAKPHHHCCLRVAKMI